MFLAIPLEEFGFSGRRFVSCKIIEGNPLRWKGSELSVLREGRPPRRIRLEGVSTASDPLQNRFDLEYSGDRIEPSDVDSETIVTDRDFETAQSRLSSCDAATG